MTFETFPYTNFQDLNLDWILKKIKELEARLDAIDVKDYDEIIKEILRRLSKAEGDIITNYNTLSTMIEQLTQVVNAHYLELRQDIITINTQITIINAALADYLQRIIALEDKVDGMHFRMVSMEDFEHMPHLPGYQYWVYDDDNLQLWLGTRQLTFRAPNYQTVLTSIWNNNRYVGQLVLTTIEEVL